MSGVAVLYLCLIAGLLVLSFFFSSSEMAYAKVNERRLKEEAKKSKAAKRALSYAAHYDKTIVTVLFGNSLVNILASSLAASLSFHAPFSSYAAAPTVIPLAMLLLLLTFGEILPKSVAKRHPHAFALAYAYPLRVFEILFFPLVQSVTWLCAKIDGLFSKKKAKQTAANDEELQAMVDEIEQQGIIDEDVGEFIHASIEFKDTCAYEVMTPRVRIEGVNIEQDLNQYVLRPNAFRHSRIPVYRGNYDHIIGYIPVKSLQRAMLRGEKLNFDKLMQPILAVPGTMEVSTILAKMKKTRHHIALVKDEYGGTDGIVTLEDILEEIVGEMYDENESVHPLMQRIGKKQIYVCDGALGVEEFFEAFHLDEEKLDDDYETLSGWITDHLGRFAKEGEEFSYEKVDVLIEKMNEGTVEKARVTYHPRKKN